MASGWWLVVSGQCRTGGPERLVLELSKGVAIVWRSRARRGRFRGARRHRMVSLPQHIHVMQIQALVSWADSCYPVCMNTLRDIETAAEVLPPEQKQELLLFLAMRLRAEGAPPPKPQRFSREQMATWIEEDETDMHRFSEGQ